MLRTILIVFAFCFHLQALAQNSCSTPFQLDSIFQWYSQPNSFDFSNSEQSGIAKATCWSNVKKEFWFEMNPMYSDLAFSVNGKNTGFGTVESVSIAIYESTGCTDLVEIQCSNILFRGYATMVVSGLDPIKKYLIRVSSLEGTFGVFVDNYVSGNYPGQDITSALRLEDFFPKTFLEITGAGYDNRETEGTCGAYFNDALESNSSWFTWIADGDGTLAFDIEPLLISDDLDFVVYELPNYSIHDIKGDNAIRCMASGGGECVGPTGLNFTSTDLQELLDCFQGDDNYLRYLDLEDGKQYGLIVNNYLNTGNSSFKISFSGSAKFKKEYPFKVNLAGSLCVNQEMIATVEPDSNVQTYIWDMGENASPRLFEGVGPHSFNVSAAGFHELRIEGYVKTKGWEVNNLNYFVNIPVPIDSINVENVSCFQGSDGSIEIESSELENLTISWSNGVNGPVNNNLPVGIYTAAIIDKLSPYCYRETTLTINSSSSELNLIIDTVIYDTTNQQYVLKLEANGGEKPYQFGLWLENSQSFVNISDTINLTESGVYHPAVKDAFGCLVIEELEIGNELGVFERPKSSLQVYPNPVQNLFHVSFSGRGDVLVYDIMGIPVYRKSNVFGKVSISSKAWKPGVYFVRLEQRWSSSTIKIVK
jgi:hypothetical protein